MWSNKLWRDEEIWEDKWKLSDGVREEEMRGKIARAEGGGSIMREIERGTKIRREREGEEGGKMSASEAIYIRQKTVPLALTATSWHRHPILVCTQQTHTQVNPLDTYTHTQLSAERMVTFHLRPLVHVELAVNKHEIKYINPFLDCCLAFISGAHT